MTHKRLLPIHRNGRLDTEELNKIVKEEERYNRLVKLNVQEQCINIAKMGVVQKSYLRNNYPLIHGWVFDVSTGSLIDLKIDFPKILSSIQEIYDLTKEV